MKYTFFLRILSSYFFIQMNRRISFIALLLISIRFISDAQDERKFSFCEDMILGGNLGLQFGTYTNLEISPVIGYYITPRWAAGIGGKYKYYRFPISKSYFETNIYGGKVFTNYLLIKDINDFIPLGINAGITANTEYEILSLEKRYFSINSQTDTIGRFLRHNVFLGGGFRFPIGDCSSFDIEILWHLNETIIPLYPSPIVRFSFLF